MNGAPSEAAEGAGGAVEDGDGKLEVPANEGGERESSPEPGFVDAKEEVGTPVGETPPAATQT